jgi:putative component of membrane protein insertase Oxa1/YidC/SpoIIIJ protein YidD
MSWQLRRSLLLAFAFVVATAGLPHEDSLTTTALKSIDWYQNNLSGRLPCVRCRHEETCSHYCKRCIEQHGLLYGTYLGLCRIASCW